MFRKYKAKYLILILLSLIFYLSSLLNCTSPTKTETVTFSGAVTLADTTDYSGVEVMLFKPVTIDTMLLNLNKNYPGVGIELNQCTEFYWREHEPVYRTTTDAQGHWKIENVGPGTYHIVAKKDGYGWRVWYDVQHTSVPAMTLKKAIVWQGTYDKPVVVPANSFVQVRDHAEFTAGLTLEAGSIVEFQNRNGKRNMDISVAGGFNVQGTEENPVYIFADDTVNSDAFTIEKTQQAQMTCAVVQQVQNGFYFKQIPTVLMRHNRLQNMQTGLTVTECDSLLIEGNFFSDFGESAIKTFDSHSRIMRNFIVKCKRIGLDSKNAKNSIVKYNVLIGHNIYGIAFNLEGYRYQSSNVKLCYNDFTNNKNHIFIGRRINGRFNNNNFYDSDQYDVFALLRYNADTLNFKENFWGTIKQFSIKEKIYDITGKVYDYFKGPIINYNDFKLNIIKWWQNI